MLKPIAVAVLSTLPTPSAPPCRLQVPRRTVLDDMSQLPYRPTTRHQYQSRAGNPASWETLLMLLCNRSPWRWHNDVDAASVALANDVAMWCVETIVSLRVARWYSVMYPTLVNGTWKWSRLTNVLVVLWNYSFTGEDQLTKRSMVNTVVVDLWRRRGLRKWVKPGFHPNAIACVGKQQQPIGCSVEAVATMIGCMLANASTCV